MSVFSLDGTVISSSQLESKAWLADRSTSIMVGVILAVHPSDSEKNYSALNHDDFRGYRNECTVLAADYLGKQPDVLITNVIIPPMRHSGMDNYEEDLPRGVRSMVDSSTYKDSFEKIDYTKLDGEWCLVGFIGGNIENAVIIGWWPHPSNVYDPATSGNGHEQAALEQFKPSNSRSRFVRRINGTSLLVNKEGSVYLDTSEANSSVKITDGKLVRTLVDKGGHLQIDLCKKAQFELNWNDKEHSNPRLGAGSTSSSPVTDPDLLHNDQPVSGQPKPRETTRTFIRGKEYELLVKTSNLNVWCAAEGGSKGELLILTDDGATISQRSGSDPAAFVQVADGGVVAQAKDGSIVTVKDDQIALATKTGGQVSVIGGQISITGPSGISMSVPVTMGPAATDGVMLGSSYVDSQETLFAVWDLFLNGLKAYTTAIASIVDPAPGNPLTGTLHLLIDALIQAKSAHENLKSDYVSEQVKAE